ncbi:MAG: SOS response-associated peptidase [Gammaproteobacteria bacterium]|nr:SOS response-associated peptidase [Gammaproteobacteria bacterium]
MCGRFTQQLSWSELHALYSVFTIPQDPALPVRYNGAPTQEFAACRVDDSGSREISILRWGLVPFWAKDTSISSRLINARAESVHSKPSFRNAFRTRRCLVPANGWFEWSSVGGAKQPYFISSENARPLSVAALWESWEKEGEPLETFTLITTQASPDLSKIHRRQPAIIEPNNYDLWLDPNTSSSSLQSLIQEPYLGPYRYHAVSRKVNSVRNNSPDILEPSDEVDLFGAFDRG